MPFPPDLSCSDPVISHALPLPCHFLHYLPALFQSCPFLPYTTLAVPYPASALPCRCPTLLVSYPTGPLPYRCPTLPVRYPAGALPVLLCPSCLAPVPILPCSCPVLPLSPALFLLCALSFPIYTLPCPCLCPALSFLVPAPDLCPCLFPALPCPYPCLPLPCLALSPWSCPGTKIG